ncbi:MAG: hypothetical protein BBJ57_07215 [Desulfobacterales bacterium PC51MH44]|nr:MAG: hypothetical protein BBJ57_07215 [Desulfobacterales bacterium PC51MH44]
MAISVNPLTYVITVPQADLDLVTGTLYELNVNTLRLWCKAWEDDYDGMPHPKTSQHFTEYMVAGVTYARAIIFLPPYSFTFEAGSYSVRLVGANTNLFDVENGILNQNQVQVISSNSAGLIVVTQGSGVTEQDKADIIDGVWDEQKAGHTDDGSYGEELATKADIAASSSTSSTVAGSGSVIEGTQGSGTYASTGVRDNTYWQIDEDGTNGLTVESTFNIPDDDRAGVFRIFGRYEGNPSNVHYIELWVYNYEATAWEQLIEEFMPGGNTTDTEYAHEYFERNIDRTNNNEVKFRLIHNVATYNASHDLYLDFAEATSIEVITASDIASAVWADSDALFLLKVVKNERIIEKTGSTWYLIIYDDDDSTPILNKALKDKDGNDITDLAAGTLAQELATSV